MNSFEWNPIYETGIANVDKQHLHLVGIINEYGNLLTEDRLTSDRLDSIFLELSDYAHYHFRDEEFLMVKYGLDKRHLVSHKQNHTNFLTEVTNLIEKNDNDVGDKCKHILDFLIRWLAYHILGADQNMSRQLAAVKSGMSSEKAYETEELQNARITEPLVAALIHLFDLVSSRNRELHHLNSSLEHKVDTRTQELSDANHHLKELALTDSLTGLFNRRYAMRALQSLWNESEDGGSNLVCLMIDADNFKQVNDSYGHNAGDEVLRELSRILKEKLRTDDILCRLGGDEFFVICPATNTAGGFQVAGQLLSAVNQYRIPAGEGYWEGSISIGIGSRNPEMTVYEDLVKKADLGVYAAKAAGRNCIREADSP